MKIIISPAKQMKTANDFMKARSLPPLLDKTEQILARMREFDRTGLKELFRAMTALQRRTIYVIRTWI